MESLTQKQKEFFERLKQFYGREPLPSFEKIAEDFGFKHKNSVWQYFNRLKDADLIREVNRRFFINPSLMGSPLYSSRVKAGFASVAEDHIERRVSLDEEFRLNSPSTFMFTVSGDSMIGLGIFDEDMVIVKKCSTANDGDVVLACIDGEHTLKTYRNKKGKAYLEPANPDYPILVPEYDLTIFGVVTGVVRKM